MGGGNAHQRAIMGRIEKQVLQVVSQILGGLPLATKETPWYETGRFWGGFGAFLAIVLTVIAAMEKDIRWLLFLAIPFAGLSWSVICKPLKPSRWHWRKAMLAILIVMTGIALWGVYLILPRPEIQSASRPPNTTPSPQPKPPLPQPKPTVPHIKPPKKENKEELPAFAVSVEWAQFSFGGKDYGTNFWIDYASRDDCQLSPIKAVYFIRVKNLQSVPATIIGYNVDVGGTPLVKVLHKIGFIVGIPNGQNMFGAKGIMNRLKPGDTINFGQGPGFSIVQIAFDRDDFSRSVFLQLDLLENLLKTPLPPNVPIRGWAFFQSPTENAFTLAGPGHVTLETDDSRTFSYAFDLRNAHPDLDMLDRTITAKSFADLSGCRHP